MTGNHQQLAELFDAVCDLDTTHRHQMLEGVDPAMRTQVLALLEADRVASRIFASQPSEAPGGAGLLAADIAEQADPEAIGPYRIAGVLGRGAMGVVYDAEQAHPRRRVALKVLHPWMRTEVALQLFRFEAQALGQLLHPGIPQVYQAGEAEGVAYLAMERVEGFALHDWARRTRASIPQRIEVLAQIARAVHAAHASGLVHRDLKPSNILVTADDQPKLLDFGIAANRRQAAGIVAGTPTYMSPEQAEGQAVDFRSDLHALGTLGYELLTGRLPAHGRTLAEIARAKRQPPTPAHHEEQQLDPDLSDVLARALAPEPEDRYPDAETFACDLERVLRTEPLPFKAHRPAYRVERFARRHRRAIGGGVVLAALLGLLWAGSLAWEARLEQQREATAAQHLEQLERSLEEPLSRDEWALVETVFRTYVDDPAHRETRSLVTAWLDHAARRAAAGRDGELDALTEAYLVSRTSADVDRVQIALARAFSDTSNWTALWQLRETLGSEARASLAPELQQTAVALRRFGNAAALGGPDAPLLADLARSRPLDDVGGLGGLVDVDGNGVPELVHMLDALHIRQLDGTPIARSELPRMAGAPGHRQFAWLDGALYGLFSTGREPGAIVRITIDTDGGSMSFEPIATVHTGRATALVRVRTPTGNVLAFATTYPERGLFIARPPLDDASPWTVEPLHADTNALGSDATSLVPYDFDGDGYDELVAGVGAWAAHDLRVLQADDDGGWHLRARARTGTPHDIQILEPADGPPVIAIAKGNQERNLRVFPAEQPYGPEAGVYFFRFTGDRLEPLGHLTPSKHDSTGPERSLSHLRSGDFDGDGRIDLALTLEMYDDRPLHHTWLVLDALGAARSHILGGLTTLAAHDLDGDGDDELYVSVDQGPHRVLGTGTEPLSPFVAGVVGDQRITLGQVPVHADPSIRRGWSRAEQLVSLGLFEEAASGMAVLARLADDPVVTARAHIEAARLYERVAAHPAAAASWSAAADLLEETADGIPDAVRDGLVRNRLWAFELQEAQRAQKRHGTDRYDWLAALAPLEPRPLLTADTLSSWRLAHPGFITRRDGSLLVEPFNDHGVLASRQVRVEGGLVALDLSLDIEGLELGSGIGVELVDGTADTPFEDTSKRRDSTRLHVSMWGQGGGGTTKVYMHCSGDALEDIGAPMRTEPGKLRIRAVNLGPEGVLRCGRDLDGDTHEQTFPDQRPIPAGTYTLRLRAAGVPDYKPPTRAILAGLELHGIGITPLPTPQTPASAANLDLLEGRVPPIGAGDPVSRALAVGDSRALHSAIDDLVSTGATTHLRWLLRSGDSELVRQIEQRTGPAFAPLYRAAWDEAAHNHPNERATQAALLLPPLDALDPATDAGSELLVWRASAHLARGALTRARVLAQTVVDTDSANIRDDVRIDAHLLLARLSRDDTDALDHLRAAERRIGVRDLLRDKVRHDPRLVGLMEQLATDDVPRGPGHR